MPHVGGEDGGGQRRRRRLALRAGHPDRRRRAQPEEEVRLRHERGHGRVALDTRVDQRAEGGPQSRLGRREVGRDRRRGRHQVGRRPGRSRVDVGAERQDHGPVPERRDPVGEIVGRPAVVDRHPGTGVGQEARQGDPAAGQPEHGDRPVPQLAGADRVEGEAVEIDRAGRRHRRHRSRSTDARNSVTPSSAARIATIQNRIVIFSSSQPPSSKWWWIGLIRNRRWPPDSRK